MKLSLERISIVVLIALIVTMQLNSCKADKERDKLVKQLEQFEITLQKFSVKQLRDSSTIATQQQTILSQKEAYRLGLLEVQEGMKKIMSQVRYAYEFYVDTVTVPFVPKNFADTTGMVRIEGGKRVQDSIAVPSDFYINQKWLTMAGQVRRSGLFFDSVLIPNKTTVTIGYERKNIFSKLKPVVTLKNDNPYIRFNSISNVVVKPKKTILDSKLFWMALGMASTIGIQQATK